MRKRKSKKVKIAKKVIERQKVKIQSNKKPRQGWEEKFKRAAKNQKNTENDLKEFREFVDDWEKNEWEW